MDDSQLMTVYEWIDSIPLSREKKNRNIKIEYYI